MKNKLLTLFIIATMLFTLASCSPMLIGKWRVTEASAGEVIMTKEDISNMGIDAGFVKLNKSGSCTVNIFGDEYEGSWTGDKNNIEFNLGEDMSANAKVDDQGIMTLTDSQGAEYKLKK